MRGAASRTGQLGDIAGRRGRPHPTTGDDPHGARDANVRHALAIARRVLGMDVAWVSRFDAGEQVFTHVDATRKGLGPPEGSSQPLAASYCRRVLDGRLPAVIPNTLAEPATRDLEVTRVLDIAAYAAVPVAGRDGFVRGMLCATSVTARPDLGAADLAFLELVAALLAELTGDTDDAARIGLQSQVLRLIEGDGRRVVLQPIIDVRTGAAPGVEALTRFDDPPHRPDRWFTLAGEAGLQVPLELAAARSALDATSERPGYVSINLSPETITSGGLRQLLVGHDPARVVIEITEHAAVEDYVRLGTVLAPHRDAGLRLAIDDAGAGYASFRHIVELRPDLIKIDLSLVRDIDTDPVRQALAASLLILARSAGGKVVAEGVETQAELDTLARLGVPFVQGYFLCRPADMPPRDGFGVPSPHVVIDGAADLALVVARAVREEVAFEGLARRLLDAVLAATGLETSYLAVLRGDDTLDHRYIRNAGSIDLPEGFALPWSDSLCSSMRDQNRIWTNNASKDLADRPAAASFGVATFLSIDLDNTAGRRIGTLCAASTETIYISDATIAQLQLIAYILSAELVKNAPPDRPHRR